MRFVKKRTHRYHHVYPNNKWFLDKKTGKIGKNCFRRKDLPFFATNGQTGHATRGDLGGKPKLPGQIGLKEMPAPTDLRGAYYSARDGGFSVSGMDDIDG
ncbi:MAG: hypothetical protein JW888_10435 [Pirellulales bacterium]|nr:hypothetical protein [Pirellulales bacterium]